MWKYEKGIEKVRNYECHACADEMRANKEHTFKKRELRPCKLSMHTDQHMTLDYCVIDGCDDSDWKEV